MGAWGVGHEGADRTDAGMDDAGDNSGACSPYLRACGGLGETLPCPRFAHDSIHPDDVPLPPPSFGGCGG